MSELLTAADLAADLRMSWQVVLNRGASRKQISISFSSKPRCA